MTPLFSRLFPLPLAFALAAVGLTTPATSAPASYRVLVIGDSISQDLGAGLYYELGASPRIQVINEGRPSSGLVDPGFYNWPAHLAKFLTQYHPQVVVVLLGANDVRPLSANGVTMPFNSPSWRRQYSASAAALMLEATAAGARVLWLGAPIMAVPQYSAGVARINTLFSIVSSGVSGVTYRATWNTLTGVPGHFEYRAQVNGLLQYVREPDGIHPTQTGWDVLATVVTRDLISLYHLPGRATAPATLTR